MESAHLCLLELLRYEGVSPETRAILVTLLQRCADKDRLGSFVLHSVELHLQEEDSSFSIALAITTERCSCRDSTVSTTQIRTCFCRAIADALNSEGTRWMSDFLLIAIGKRKRQGRGLVSLSSRVGIHKTDHIADASDIDRVEEMVRLRDGPNCCISGSVDNVVGVQIIPISHDTGRLDRFLQLAGVFFQKDIVPLTDDQLCSPANTILVSTFWKNCFDEGRIVIKLVAGEHYTPLVFSQDVDRLVQERKLNGLTGPPSLRLCTGPVAHHFEGLNPDIVLIHQVITEMWHETGLANRLINEMRWVDCLPNDGRAIPILGEAGFRSVLQHKLMIM